MVKKQKHTVDQTKSAKTTTDIDQDTPAVGEELLSNPKKDDNIIDKPSKKPKSNRGKYPMPAILRVLCSLAFLIVVSIFITWFILWRQNMCDADTTMEFIQEKSDIATYSYLVIFGLLAIISAITWRPFFSTGLFFCIVSILTFVHMQKFELRGEPFLPEEIALAENAGDMIEFVDATEIQQLIWGVIFVLIGSILAEYCMRRVFGRNRKKLAWWDRFAIVPRITFTMVALAFFAGIAHPVLDRTDMEWIDGLDLIAWDQIENYEFNGIIVGFLYNFGDTTVKQPEDYSAERIAEITDKYSKLKHADTDRVSLSDEVDNIIVILNETFYDPALLTKYYDHVGGDVTPNLHKIFREYPSGYMYSPEYGGGTANVEFEVQTGLSNYWAKTFPYVNTISKMDKLFGVASWSKQNGFDTTAIHSYGGSFYKRNIVYPKIGYNQFIDDEEMQFTEKDYSSNVINDRSVYREIISLLKDSDKPQMIGAVTMQNHAPYWQAEYPDKQFWLKNDKVDNNWDIVSSFQSLYYSDKYLGEFIEELDKLKERTVVLWFGDHAMGQLSLYASSSNQDDKNIAHLTPYFVYANFDIKSPYTERETAKFNTAQGLDFGNIRYVKGVDLPTTTPNCIQNTMYNVLGVEKPTLYYLLDEVCSTTPILSNAYYGGESPSDSITPYHEYELLNYDILYGQHYWKEEN